MKYVIDSSTLVDIADAIREKEGTDEPILVSDMAERIADISGGDSNIEEFEWTPMEDENIFVLDSDYVLEDIEEIKIENISLDNLVPRNPTPYIHFAYLYPNGKAMHSTDAIFMYSYQLQTTWGTNFSFMRMVSDTGNPTISYDENGNTIFTLNTAAQAGYFCANRTYKVTIKYKEN